MFSFKRERERERLYSVSVSVSGPIATYNCDAAVPLNLLEMWFVIIMYVVPVEGPATVTSALRRTRCLLAVQSPDRIVKDVLLLVLVQNAAISLRSPVQGDSLRYGVDGWSHVVLGCQRSLPEKTTTWWRSHILT